jgi:hypothetical protein
MSLIFSMVFDGCLNDFYHAFGDRKFPSFGKRALKKYNIYRLGGYISQSKSNSIHTGP